MVVVVVFLQCYPVYMFLVLYWWRGCKGRLKKMSHIVYELWICAKSTNAHFVLELQRQLCVQMCVNMRTYICKWIMIGMYCHHRIHIWIFSIYSNYVSHFCSINSLTVTANSHMRVHVFHVNIAVGIVVFGWCGGEYHRLCIVSILWTVIRGAFLKSYN